MPTIISHPAVPLAIGCALGAKVISPRLLTLGVLGAALPDLDVIAFRFGVPYEAALGHRGVSHSLVFAVIIAALTVVFFKFFRTKPIRAFCFMCISVGSHGVLDTFTNGGHGVALLWPWSSNRYFAPYQPIEVSPLSISGFFSDRGLVVLQSELTCVWLPALVIASVLIASLFVNKCLKTCAMD